METDLLIGFTQKSKRYSVMLYQVVFKSTEPQRQVFLDVPEVNELKDRLTCHWRPTSCHSGSEVRISLDWNVFYKSTIHHILPRPVCHLWWYYLMVEQIACEHMLLWHSGSNSGCMKHRYIHVRHNLDDRHTGIQQSYPSHTLVHIVSQVYVQRYCANW